MIIIINGSRESRVKKAKISQDMMKHLSLFNTFISSFDFRLAGATADTGFFVCFPKDRATPHEK